MYSILRSNVIFTLDIVNDLSYTRGPLAFLKFSRLFCSLRFCELYCGISLAAGMAVECYNCTYQKHPTKPITVFKAETCVSSRAVPESCSRAPAAGMTAVCS